MTNTCQHLHNSKERHEMRKNSSWPIFFSNFFPIMEESVKQKVSYFSDESHSNKQSEMEMKVGHKIQWSFIRRKPNIWCIHLSEIFFYWILWDFINMSVISTNILCCLPFSCSIATSFFCATRKLYFGWSPYNKIKRHSVPLHSESVPRRAWHSHERN